MIRIAHRGNTNGPSHKENEPGYIEDAISKGFDVEFDLWRVEDSLWLGHDEPKYLITDSFLVDNSQRSWIHCKNLEALYYLNTKYPELNYFWHQEDDFTLTSQGYIWAYPGMQATDKTVVVSLNNENVEGAYGICSDVF